ncbi:MAG: hypothetical protein HRT89_21025 [Lentisphaeria bacterium]|nr:protein N-terminal glutamine amidohydrolase [Lentisphaeria bacterium]NQZ70543.1 hypothetical protein [Lentisphaeria bacterium]
MKHSYKYCPFYCEENIWHLANQIKNGHVIFISNALRQTAVFNQLNCFADEAIFWDYHVVLIKDKQVYDFDSRLGFPIALSDYLQQSFQKDIAAEHQAKFKVIPATDFLAKFASDRRHMVDDDGLFIADPPDWDCITTNESSFNLDAFIDMTKNEYPVLSRDELEQHMF